MNYYVICRDDNLDGSKGKYVLVTSRSFPCYDDAAVYASGIAPSREPKILLEVLPLKD